MKEVYIALVLKILDFCIGNSKTRSVHMSWLAKALLFELNLSACGQLSWAEDYVTCLRNAITEVGVRMFVHRLNGSFNVVALESLKSRLVVKLTYAQELVDTLKS